tara:strand:- start:41 stop:262 length:222 start_codon:yes stop_codon:yes gene_type:complete
MSDRDIFLMIIEEFVGDDYEIIWDKNSEIIVHIANPQGYVDAEEIRNTVQSEIHRPTVIIDDFGTEMEIGLYY